MLNKAFVIGCLPETFFFSLNNFFTHICMQQIRPETILYVPLSQLICHFFSGRPFLYSFR